MTRHDAAPGRPTEEEQVTVTDPAGTVLAAAEHLRAHGVPEHGDAPKILATMLEYLGDNPDLPDAVLAARFRGFALALAREILPKDAEAGNRL